MGSKYPAVRELEKELKTVVNWFGFGVSIGMPSDLLQAIRKDFRQTSECRLEMFIRWQEREKPTWPKVVQALEDIGLKKLAKEISEKYCQGKYIEEQEDQEVTSPPPQSPDTCEQEDGQLGFRYLPKIRKYLYEIPLQAHFDLGLVLGLDYIKLKRFKDTKPEDFLDNMIAAWIRQEDQVESVTWESLVVALRDDTIGQSGVARKIEDKEISPKSP